MCDSLSFKKIYSILTDTPYAFLNFGLSPERNIHEKEISSVESSNPGSVVSPNGPFKFNDPTSEQKESCCKYFIMFNMLKLNGFKYSSKWR